mgnify:CR=1 FL=1
MSKCVLLHKFQMKRTRGKWTQEDIEWLTNGFQKWKELYIKTNFPNSTAEDLKKWIINIPELFLKRCSIHLEKSPNVIKKKLILLGLIVR